MSSVLKISEAAVLALHSMAYLAVNPGKLSSTKEIATKLRISEDRKSTRLNSSHIPLSRMPSSA